VRNRSPLMPVRALECFLRVRVRVFIKVLCERVFIKGLCERVLALNVCWCVRVLIKHARESDYSGFRVSIKGLAYLLSIYNL